MSNNKINGDYGSFSIEMGKRGKKEEESKDEENLKSCK